MIDTTIPLWQLITVTFIAISVGAVALYRLAGSEKMLSKHEVHVADDSIHQTKAERLEAAATAKLDVILGDSAVKSQIVMVQESDRRELAAHIAMDEKQFLHITETMKEVKGDIKDGHTRIHDSITDLRKLVEQLRK